MAAATITRHTVLKVEPVFTCECGALIRTEGKYLGLEATCAQCKRGVPLTRDRLHRPDLPRFFCPCCGFRTLTRQPPGTYDICIVCWWEDDAVQFRDPDYEGGANRLSLRRYQREFLDGALELPALRPEALDFMEVDVEVDRDPTWRVLGNSPAGERHDIERT